MIAEWCFFLIVLLVAVLESGKLSITLFVDEFIFLQVPWFKGCEKQMEILTSRDGHRCTLSSSHQFHTAG